MTLQIDDNLLDTLGLILTDDQLNEQIQKQTDIEVLKLVLDVKLKRNSQEPCHLIKTSLFHRIFDEKCNAEVLKKIIRVSDDPKGLLYCLAAMFNKQPSETSNLRLLEILHVLLSLFDSCIEDETNLMETVIDVSVLHGVLVKVLTGKEASLKTYLLTDILPLCFYKIGIESQVIFLNQLVSLCLDLKSLESLCSIYENIEHIIIDNEVSFIDQADFWNFLAECLSSPDNCLQKQATYILSKTVNFLLGHKVYNTYVITGSGFQKRIWDDFFILLDISREKQLHLVKPCLTLLNSVGYLHMLWQKCLYKILLNHSQMSIVYSVASYLLQQNCDKKTIIYLILLAINKNEYSNQSNSMFEHFKLFCLNLDQDQFNCLLDQILLVAWNPTSMWCVFKNIFVTEGRNVVTAEYYKDIFQLIQNLPHIHIRNACENIFTNYFVNNFAPKNFADIMNVLMTNYSTKRVLEKIKSFKISDTEVNLLLKEHRDDYNYCKRLLYVLTRLNYDNKLLETLNDTAYVHPVSRIIYELDRYSLEDVQKFLISSLPKDLTESNVEGFQQLLIHYSSKTESGSVHDLVFKMLNDTNMPRFQAVLCFEFLLKCYPSHVNSVINVLLNWKSTILNNKVDDYLCDLYIEIFFRVCFNHFDSGKTKEIIEMCSILLDIQGDSVVGNIYDKLDKLLYYSEERALTLNFIDKSFEYLKNFTKRKGFRQISCNFLDTFFSLDYFNSVKYDFVKISSIIKELFKLYENHHSIRFHIAKKLYQLGSDHQFKVENLQFLAPYIIDLFLQGVIIKKEERVEYDVCKDIFQNTTPCKKHERYIRKSGVCPYYTYAEIRIVCLKTILIMVQRNYDLIDVFVSYLIRKYSEHFKKRYFPDSQVHFQKLRIFQILLTISPLIKNKPHLRTKITHLITNSFQEEIHQNCVRQLMQWLLIVILLQNEEKDSDFGVELIKNVVNISVKTQPSSVTSLIPVLYHVTLAKPQRLKDTIDVLLPWSMGAQFKLRTYSQIAIKNLIEKLTKGDAHPYDLIQKSINLCVEASGTAFHDTLKTDHQIFNYFEPDRDLSLETIFYDIPRLNQVTPREWEGMIMKSYDDENFIPILNKDRTFSESIDNIVENNKNRNLVNGHSTEIPVVMTDTDPYLTNVQKKITPWKANMTDTTNDATNSNFILIASLIDKPQNLGGLMRTCEVFGVKQLVLHDAKVTNDKEFRSLSMSSEKLVDVVEVKLMDLKKFIAKLKSNGYCVVGAEQTSESVKLNEFQFKRKTAVLLGNEKEGMPPNLIPLLDTCLEIPQFGYVRSLNVHVAGAMFIWEYTKQHLMV